MKQAILFSSLALALCACPAVSGVPRVVSVDPGNGETGVPTNVTLRAELSLPDGMINVTTLTPETAILTDDAGTPVEAKRTMSEDGETLIVDPTSDLEPATTYRFDVTPGLKTAAGTALQVFSSSFTTGAGPGVEPDPTRSLTPDRERVVFSAGGDSSSDTRTLTLTNTGDETVNVSNLSISGPDTAQFSLADDGGFSLAPGASRALTLTFIPGGLGPQLATLTITSDDSLSPTLTVPLGGLGVQGQGGNLEPSLQWIFDTYGLPISSGDADPGTTPLVTAPINTTVGDEVSAQIFTKASPTEPVTAEVLAVFGVENDPVLEFGYYTAGSAAARTKLFDVQPTPTLNAQRLAPDVTGGTNGVVTFNPGADSFGLYSFWPTNTFFGERYVYTEDTLNTFTQAIPHQVRTYPLVNSDGEVEPNAYVLATEEFSQGFDYNDVVVILRNVVPEDIDPPQQPVDVPPATGIPGLNVSNVLGEPYSDRLVLQKIANTTGSFCEDVDPLDPTCDPEVEQWADIAFPTTGTVRLQNVGGSALQLSLRFANEGLFTLPGGENALTLQPGGTYDLIVEFTANSPKTKGVYPSGLIVQSGTQSAGIQLAGLFMRRPEGGREVYFAPLINDLFGYKTDVGAISSGGLRSPEPDSPLAGEEVRSAYWEAASDGPVSVLQLAAFYPCCNSLFSLQLFARGNSNPFETLRPVISDTQSIYPRQGNGELSQLTTNPNGPFEVRVASYSSDPNKGAGNGRLGVRFWPLRDRAGSIVPNTYIISQDFVRAGCNGSGSEGEAGLITPSQTVPPTEPPSNCDYNDNLYIISNVTPAN